MSGEEISNSEKQIFVSIDLGDTVLLRAALVGSPNVNIVDENLMTPLQHAAYKGKKEMVQMLLDYVSFIMFLLSSIEGCFLGR